MDIEKFARQIKIANKKDRNMAILTMLGFLAFDFCVILTSEYKIGVLLLGECIVIATALNAGRYQWNRYLYYYEEVTGINTRKSLCKVMRMQAFPVKEYFSYVNKKMYLPALLLGVGSVVMGILEATGEEGKPFSWKLFGIMLCFGVLNVLCPFVVGIGKKKIWMYQSKMGSKGKLNMLLMISRLLFTIVEYLYVTCVSVIAVFFLWVILRGLMSPKIDETMVVLRIYSNLYSLILIIVILFAALWAILNFQIIKLAKLVGSIACLLFVTFIIVLVIEVHSYTEFSFNQIKICQPWKENTYSLEEVKSYHIYEEDEGIQLKLYFEDGNTAQLSNTSQTYSNLYEQAYYSEYNFIADYMERLNEVGASGQIEDIEKLREDAAELDPELQNGLEKIIQVMKKE